MSGENRSTALRQPPAWAAGVPIRVEGAAIEANNKTIHLIEKNRATVFVSGQADFRILQKITQESYLAKGVGAVLVGINGLRLRFAVYVEDGFLTTE